MDTYVRKRIGVTLAIVIGASPITVVPTVHAGDTKTCDSALSCGDLKGKCSAGNGVYSGYTQGTTHWGICWFPVAINLG